MHAAFLSTLQRFKKLGIDHVIVYRDAGIIDTNANPLQFINSVPWSISDSEMAWIVAQARTFGLEIHEHRQINNVDMNNVPLPTAPTQAWASNYLDAYTTYIVDRARVAQQNGVEAFLLDWGVYWFDWTPYKDLFISKMTNAAQQVRSVYSGKILYGKTAPWISGNAALLNSIDWFVGELWAGTINMTAAENANLTVPLLKQKYLSLMKGLANALGPIRKPMAWGVFAQSHRNYLLSGWVEDGFCVNGCSQQSIQIDFSIQAMAYEAMLEAIAEQTLFTTASVDAYAYWYLDVMLPKDSFPNLSQSWRNKPAESILYQWFRRSSSLASAVLPASRSVQVGVPATAFATIINTSNSTITGCGISPVTSVPGTFTFQATDPSTNQTIGTPNTPMDVSAGAAQSYVFALTPTSPIVPTDVQLSFDCANSSPAPTNTGLNTLLLSASATPVPDIVALAATSGNDGIVNVAGSTGTGAFAVATVNVGATGAITASADAGGLALPVNISLCQTDPASGQCISSIGPSVTTQINANATPTFGIFVQGNENVPFDPAANRVFVRFKDGGGVTRGSTSVAVRTQ